MDSWTSVFGEIKRSVSDVSEIEGLFQRFALNFNSFAKKDQGVFANASVNIGEPPDQWRVRLCGRNFVFHLTTTSDQHGYATGEVTCYVVLDFPKQRAIEIASFVLTADGMTDLIDIGTGRELQVISEREAAMAVALCVHKALTINVKTAVPAPQAQTSST